MSKRKHASPRPSSERPRSGGREPRKGGSKASGKGGPPWLFGRHAVVSALANPARNCHQLLISEESASAHGPEVNDAIHASGRSRPDPHVMSRRDLDEVLGNAVHQGFALQADPLPRPVLEDGLAALEPDEAATYIVLDQATDPQNIGSVLRSAAAFGAHGMIVPDRNTPEITGALAKAASGAVETTPIYRVGNLARALEELKKDGFWCVGLDGTAEQMVGETDLPDRLVIIMGSEGTGLRRLTRELCDFLLRIPISPVMESLNLSNAATIMLYESARKKAPAKDSAKDGIKDGAKGD